MSEEDTGKTESEAIFEFCSSCVVPIVAENDLGAGIHGTGTLFQYGNNHFLISADHVLSPIPKHANHIGIPISKEGSEILTFNRAELIHCIGAGESERYDVAMLVLTEEIASRLKQDYFFLTKKNICHIGNRSRPFYVYGFPFELTKQDLVHVRAHPLRLWTERYVGNVGELSINCDPNIDFFLSYPAQLHTDTVSFDSPELPGISGTTIWHRRERVDIDQPKLWSAANEMKCVGIQVSYRKGFWMRAKQWHVVASMFKQFGKEAEEELRNALIENQ